MTYIYLNIYPNGYMYVGSHSWDGPKGVLDPKYKGSSLIAKNYRWKPSEIKILKDDSGKNGTVSALKLEAVYINDFCTKYGIADCVYTCCPENSWIRTFKPHGKMLNAHNNLCDHLFSEECQRKSAEGRRRFLNTPEGKEWLKMWSEARYTKENLEKTSKVLHEFLNSPEGKRVHQKALDAAMTEESREKAIKAIKKFNLTEEGRALQKKRVDASLKPEAREKQYKSRQSNEKYKYVLSNGFIGTSGQIAKKYGISPSFASSWCRGKMGTPRVLKGITVKPYECVN